MTGSGARRKGHDYERLLARKFREVMPGADIRRGLQFRGGHEAPDVECPVFWIESKRGKKPNIRAALKQASAGGPKGRIPIAIVRDDRAEATVTFYLDDFLDFVQEWWEASSR